VSLVRVISPSLLGTIPEELFQLADLQVLDLSDNSLAGTIPDIPPLLGLEAVNVSKNQLNGAFPPSLCLCPALRRIDVSFTSLSGPLPEQLANLTHLHEIKVQMTKLDITKLGM
jgi:Leucine-rich repeat (LRR) protein